MSAYLQKHRGFTLVELLVSTAILAIILLVIFSITQQTGRVWKSSQAKIESFQGARAAFESLTRKLGQATLNGYYDYFDASGRTPRDPAYDGQPARYGRQSDLHFISGPGLLTNPSQISHAVFFQAPLGYANSTAWSGLDGALNAVGYYVAYNDDAATGGRPGFVSEALSPLKHRFRLMQFTQSLQDLNIFKTANATGTGWFTGGTAPAGNNASTRPLADNIIALVILPKKSAADDASETSLTTDYTFDSRTPWSGTTQPQQMNQLPPILHVVMVALDEPSAQRVCVGDAAPDLGIPSLFHDPSKLDDDIATLEGTLKSRNLNYQVFQADIGIRGAKWSQ
ncbi:Verru_Chthon cassette protein C [Terrimicrobium sacchariphilum]|uniref:Verru_Chthon cassette protein C n=1 Tax=Terrimicrobium sacchariphilum TaxID=690879 RepID=A0A146GDG3_TERSA|nr:Verru_Chthon cassette protein C [Terrimicrobium sacchariphilum]GAT34687.1 Verru_Chthon cassette protein C [Terrimicrobium sacchariphilum]